MVSSLVVRLLKKRNKCTASYQKKPDGTPDYQAFLAKRELKDSKQEQGEKTVSKNTEKKEKKLTVRMRIRLPTTNW
ncbi:hypothetical protein ACT4WO_19950 (plasmid) [Acinetobacter baumannii]